MLMNPSKIKVLVLGGQVSHDLARLLCKLHSLTVISDSRLEAPSARRPDDGGLWCLKIPLPPPKPPFIWCTFLIYYP
jgi:hypothetical protein